MVTSSIFAFLHFAAVFGIVGAVVYQWLTWDRQLGAREARRIQLSDRWYGVSFGVVLVVGLLRAYLFEKGKDFYFTNPVFMLKLTLFVVLALLSAYPTIRYLAWRHELKRGAAPAISERQYLLVARLLRAELVVLLAIALSASLMAKGIRP